MKSSPETLCEANFEATVTRFEFASKFSRKSKCNSPTPRIPGFAANGGRGPVGIRELGSGSPRPRNGRSFSKPTASSRRPFGEVHLFISSIVLLDGKICSERMKLNQKALLETHIEATVSRREFPAQFSRRSKVVRAESLALQRMGEGAQLASAGWGPAVPGREMDVHADSCSAILQCQILETALLSHRFVPKG